MTSEATSNNPPLASLIRSGDTQQAAEKITDFIFMAHDISNAYLITTADGDVMVNTGFMDDVNIKRNQALLTPARSGPLRYIILTQAHPDHYGGVDAFREPQTQVIAHQRFCETWEYFHNLGPYLQRRTDKLWSSIMQRGDNPPVPPRVIPDIEVDRSYTFELGGRHFEVISTPGGESLCGLTVWLPEERIVFTGNLFGPVFMSMPNLMTMRGDKPRLVMNYLESLDRVRTLNARILITGHGDPIVGEQRVRESLDTMYNAVTFIKDAVIAGMNAGQSVHELMRAIKLPPELKIGEFHGKVSWAVKSIWQEFSSWFYYDTTTSLYEVPRSSVDRDIVELAGGVDKLVGRAAEKLSHDMPLEALHLLDIVLGVESDHAAALSAKKQALSQLLEHSGGHNLSETMWLRSEMSAIDAALVDHS